MSLNSLLWWKLRKLVGTLDGFYVGDVYRHESFDKRLVRGGRRSIEVGIISYWVSVSLVSRVKQVLTRYKLWPSVGCKVFWRAGVRWPWSPVGYSVRTSTVRCGVGDVSFKWDGSYGEGEGYLSSSQSTWGELDSSGVDLRFKIRFGETVVGLRVRVRQSSVRGSTMWCRTYETNMYSVPGPY